MYEFRFKGGTINECSMLVITQFAEHRALAYMVVTSEHFNNKVTDGIDCHDCFGLQVQLNDYIHSIGLTSVHNTLNIEDIPFIADIVRQVLDAVGARN